MPLPRSNETWRDSSGTELLVSRTTGDLVHLVNLHGDRFIRTLSEITSNWWMITPAPPTFQRCSRYGCSRPAFLRYQRPASTQRFELVCPLHTPKGALVQRVATFQTNVTSFYGDRCRTCSSDAIEVFTANNPDNAKLSIWQCGTANCANNWMIVHELHAIMDRSKLASAVPTGYRINEHLNASHEGWVVILAPTGTREETMTFFDYITGSVDK